MKRWPLNKAYVWERLPFLRLLPPLVAGIYFYPKDTTNKNFFVYLIAALLLSIITYGITVFRKQQSKLSKAIGFGTLHVSLFLVAWVLCHLQDDRNRNDWFGHSIDTAEAYIVKVTGAPIEKERTWKLEVNVTASVVDNQTNSASGKAFLYLYKYDAPGINEGDELIVPNKWQPITNTGNTFEFDYAAFTARNNIHLQQFIPGSKVLIHKYATSKDLRIIRRIHHYCIDRLYRYIHDDATLGLMQAMLLGDKAELDIKLRQAYADTGIVHIIAISGAHIAIFFMLVAFLFKPLKHRRYNWIKYIAALPLIWLYVFVAGAPTSAVRAATMFSILAVGFALQKEPNGINQLLAAAFILLCINPHWLFDVGFQLSFTAVLSIFLFYRPIFKLIPVYNRVLRGIWSAVSVSIAAEILVAPVVIYYFHLFPIQFIVANLIAYFFMGIILIGGLLLLMLSPFNSVARIMAEGLTKLADLFNYMVFKLQTLNPQRFHRLTLTKVELLLTYLFITCLAIFLFNKNKRYLFTSLGCLCFMVVSFVYREYRALSQNMVIVYNAGKQNYVDLISGKNSKLIISKSGIPDDVNFFAIKPAHIGYNISETEIDTTSNFFTLGGESYFILNHPATDTNIQVNNLIINYKIKERDVPSITESLHPKLVILGNILSSSKAAQIENAFKTHAIPVHNVRTKGAYIFKQD
ncbi:MAG: ComEC family competence protein [Chitinophagales bacterium]|nr:ComEC family competence protein [Chitinophagaceae bacterium]MCB9065289.1 ComEC family competence protein [Chitinophagales bacterium]